MNLLISIYASLLFGTPPKNKPAYLLELMDYEVDLYTIRIYTHYTSVYCNCTMFWKEKKISYIINQRKYVHIHLVIHVISSAPEPALNQSLSNNKMNSLCH